jgi:hypothetical protein
MATRTPSEQLAILRDQRVKANSRVANVEGEQRDAAKALLLAKEAVAEFFRRGGGRSADQQRLEAELVTAQARFDEPWVERIDGVRRAARDAQDKVAAFVEENLVALIETLEAEGDVIAANFAAAVQTLVTAGREREAVSARITELYAMCVSVAQPNAVPASRASGLLKEADRFLLEGGEPGPRLRRELIEPVVAGQSVMVEPASV